MTSLEPVKSLSMDAYEFLSKLKDETPAEGRYDLADGVFVNIQSYKTCERSTRQFEAHRDYIDLQYIISGREIIVVEDTEVLRKHGTAKEYTPDIEFFFDHGAGKAYTLNPGDYLILRPQDAHMPCVCVDKPEEAVKAVVKIPVALDKS